MPEGSSLGVSKVPASTIASEALHHVPSAGRLAAGGGPHPTMSGPIDMKVRIDIDCTPQEARTFFGLPDLEPMQGALLGKIQQRLTDYLDTRDGEALLKLWFPAGVQNFGQMQEAMWQQFMGGLSAAAAPGGKRKEQR
jgi:hypothetical protein